VNEPRYIITETEPSERKIKMVEFEMT